MPEKSTGSMGEHEIGNQVVTFVLQPSSSSYHAGFSERMGRGLVVMEPNATRQKECACLAE